MLDMWALNKLHVQFMAHRQAEYSRAADEKFGGLFRHIETRRARGTVSCASERDNICPIFRRAATFDGQGMVAGA